MADTIILAIGLCVMWFLGALTGATLVYGYYRRLDKGAKP